MVFLSYCSNGAAKHVNAAHNGAGSRMDALVDVNEGNLSKLENEMATYFYEDFVLSV